MANPTGAFGLRPIGRNGGPYNGPLHRVYIPSGTTTAAWIGDVVQLAGSADGSGYATVGPITAATGIPYGVITGFDALPSDLSKQYNPAAQAGGRYAKVVLCDEAVFLVKADGVMAAADVGGNCDLDVDNGGSNVTGMSGMVLDASNVTTTVGDMLQIQGFEDSPNNDLTLTNANVIVKFNDAATHPDRLGLAT